MHNNVNVTCKWNTRNARHHPLRENPENPGDQGLKNIYFNSYRNRRGSYN